MVLASAVGFEGSMEKEIITRLRVLVADGPGVRLDDVTRTVAGWATT
ncbi:MAG: hypothetical protein M3Q23_07050 [Actinomycetota bacterium]|nr:hypothetical protein [Actinomycetota bacterium]